MCCLDQEIWLRICALHLKWALIILDHTEISQGFVLGIELSLYERRPSRQQVNLFKPVLLRIQACVLKQQGMQLAAHIIDGPGRFTHTSVLSVLLTLYLNKLLVWHHQFEQPRVELRIRKYYLAVLIRDYLLALVLVLQTVWVPLGQHKQVLQRALSHHVVWEWHQRHQYLQCGFERNFVVVVDDQVFE